MTLTCRQHHSCWLLTDMLGCGPLCVLFYISERASVYHKPKHLLEVRPHHLTFILVYVAGKVDTTWGRGRAGEHSVAQLMWGWHVTISCPNLLLLFCTPILAS